ncbi:MAG TPA: L-threonylcarbamoyladenylate synthase [Arenimonas sp.]|nr:L-threonylcarbamoyladenylate synthase [Arenimonas sp.]
MAERWQIHPVTPQARLMEKAAERLRDGALVLLPTDAGYCLAWSLNAKEAEDRVLRLRELDSRHPFTLLCRQLSEAGRLARLDDQAFRLMRSLTPGPCTFILPASAELPKRIRNSGRRKRRDIGIRLPAHRVTQALLEAVGEPLLSTSLVLPGDEVPASHEAEDVAERWLRWADLMLDAEDCEPGPTSVVDCTGEEPTIVRQGFHPVAL